ncbi:MAG: histidine kinase dimerization/phospho-acceptor domain-containing protein, partial [Anaerolineae bacterium]|nr:histidine kinase dimerization/phospho-acceptor domain-containing protein [Anaerolineae bacterium]
MRRYALAIGPLLAGVALALLWQAGLWANPILYLRADVGTLLFLVGAGASALCTLGMALWAQAGRCHERKTFMLRQEQAESHRRFVRRLDHELKNPLTAIRIGLANLSGQCDGATMASLRAQVDRLAHLTADLRKLADLEMQPLELEPVDLGQLLTEVVESAQERPERQSRHLELSLPRAPW